MKVVSVRLSHLAHRLQLAIRTGQYQLGQPVRNIAQFAVLFVQGKLVRSRVTIGDNRLNQPHKSSVDFRAELISPAWMPRCHSPQANRKLPREWSART